MKFATTLLSLFFATAASAERSEKFRLAQEGRGVQDQYLVIYNNAFNEDAVKTDLNAKLVERGNPAGARVVNAFARGAIRGGVLRGLSPAQMEEIAQDENVRYVQQDYMIHGAQQSAFEQQDNAPWGLDRIDQDDTDLDGAYQYKYTGKDVDIWIVDSGIRTNHEEFGGRVSCEFLGDYLDGLDVECDANSGDEWGHGTFVAGIAGGSTYGVAKDANLYAARILDGNGDGWSSDIILALIEIMDVHDQSGNPTVVNLSINGKFMDDTLNDTMKEAESEGIVLVASAGNESDDACDYSPGSQASAITVGSTDAADDLSSYTNNGNCVNIYAPGDGIVSAYNTGNSATTNMDGTSFSAPFVAGIAALYLEENPDMTPAEVKAKLVSNASTLSGGNLLLQNQVCLQSEQFCGTRVSDCDDCCDGSYSYTDKSTKQTWQKCN